MSSTGAPHLGFIISRPAFWPHLIGLAQVAQHRGATIAIFAMGAAANTLPALDLWEGCCAVACSTAVGKAPVPTGWTLGSQLDHAQLLQGGRIVAFT